MGSEAGCGWMGGGMIFGEGVLAGGLAGLD